MDVGVSEWTSKSPCELLLGMTAVVSGSLPPLDQGCADGSF
jgi:hypothetical protein